MAKDKDKKQDDDELDLASLSALVRPSEAPAQDDKDDNDGKLDLRALVASVPPPAAVEAEPVKVVAPVVEAKREEAPVAKATSKKAASAKKEEKAAVVAVAAAPAPAPASGGGMGIGIGLGIGLAIAGVAWFAMNGKSTTTADEHRVVEDQTQVVVAATGPARADRLREAPSAIEAADHESEPAPVVAAAPPSTVEAEESDDDEDVEAPEAEEQAAEESETQHTSHRSRRGSRSSASAAPAPAATTATAAATVAVVAPAPTPPPATTTARRSGGGLDSVLDQALGSSRTPPPSSAAHTPAASARTAPAGDLPDQPSQTDVRRVLGGMLSQVRACAGEQVGMVTFTLMVRSDGTVVSSSASGSPFGGTPQGTCMEGVLRGAHFPAFRQAQFRVQYPMRI